MPQRRSGSLVQKIRLHLEDQIISGKLKPRQRLVEEDIAGEMGVSRSPVREALRTLERDGLITLTPGRGAQVADLTPAEVDEVYSIRSRLGGLLFALAAQTLSDRELDRIEHVLREMKRVVSEGDIHRYFLLDLEFDEIVMAACPNKKLLDVWRNLGRSILRFRYFSFFPPGRLQASLDYHRRLVAALRGHDAEGADRLVQETLAAAGAALREHLKTSVG